MKDFIKNIPKEDEDHTLLIGMDKIKCIWKREDNIFPNPLFPIIEITTKDKIKKKKIEGSKNRWDREVYDYHNSKKDLEIESIEIDSPTTSLPRSGSLPHPPPQNKYHQRNPRKLK